MSDELKPLCSACGGEGIIRTGITEAPTTNCRDCKGSGFAPAAPVAQDPDAGEREFNAARLRRLVNLLGLGNAVPEGDLLGVMGSVLGMVAREIEELKAAAAQEPVAWMWKMHGWAITAHSKNRAVQTFVDVSRPPTSTIESPDFISLTPLYAAPVPAIPPSETGWLIEIQGAPRPLWLRVNGSATTDANEAIRFCRRVDADGFLEVFLSAKFGDDVAGIYRRRLSVGTYVVTEHMWIAAAPQSPVPQDVKDAERYRWLRDSSVGQWEHPIVVMQDMVHDVMRYTGPMAYEALDHAIDNAIAAQDAGKGGAK